MLFRFVTFHAFERQSDGQTDGRTFRSWLRPPCIDAARYKPGQSDQYSRAIFSEMEFNSDCSSRLMTKTH